MKNKNIIRNIYLYLTSFIGLILIIIGLIKIIDLTLKLTIFKKANEVIIYPIYPNNNSTLEEKNFEKFVFEEKQKEFEKKQKEIENYKIISNALAMIITGLPLFIYHWFLILKEKN